MQYCNHSFIFCRPLCSYQDFRIVKKEKNPSSIARCPRLSIVCLPTYHLLKTPNNKSLSKENHFFKWGFQLSFIFSLSVSQGNKHKAPAAREGFCKRPRMIDKKKDSEMRPELHRNSSRQYKMYSRPSFALCKFFQQTCHKPGATGSFISNCQALILKAQLISPGCAWFQDLCYTGVKSDEICLWGFDPNIPF